MKKLLSKSIHIVPFFALSFFCLIMFASNARSQTKPSTDKTPAAKVSICKEIDDDWKCVGESKEWKANTPFNVLFENMKPVGVDFIGIVFYKQGADGKDIEHINEYQQQIGEKNSKYATVGDDLKLPAGIYSVYVISWGKRELMMKNGNLTDYLAKTTLMVK